MTVEFRLNGFNASHAKSFYKVLNWYGLTYTNSTDNNTRIIKFDYDFTSSIEFIDFCKEVSNKYVERKTQKVWKYNKFYVDIAINTITKPYVAVFTLYVEKA